MCSWKQRGAARQLFGRVVFENRSDDRAFGKCRLLREQASRGRCGHRADSQCFESPAAGHTLRKRF